MSFTDTRQQYEAQMVDFLVACNAELERIVKKHHPDAIALETEGEWTEDHILSVHPYKIRLGNPLGGYTSVDPSDDLAAEVWEPLSYMAELTGDSLSRSTVIEFG